MSEWNKNEKNESKEINTYYVKCINNEWTTSKEKDNVNNEKITLDKNSWIVMTANLKTDAMIALKNFKCKYIFS